MNTIQTGNIENRIQVTVYTNSSKICVEIELDKDDIYEYSIAPKDDFELIRKSVIEAIEKISNEGDDEYFYNHILTDYGKENNGILFSDRE